MKGEVLEQEMRMLRGSVVYTINIIIYNWYYIYKGLWRRYTINSNISDLFCSLTCPRPSVLPHRGTQPWPCLGAAPTASDQVRTACNTSMFQYLYIFIYFCDWPDPIQRSIATFKVIKANSHRTTREHIAYTAANADSMHEVCILHRIPRLRKIKQDEESNKRGI